MTETHELNAVPVDGAVTHEAANAAAAAPAAVVADGAGVALNRHAEAGRKGARRVHELIREGRLYEQEHGLKRGRQRLRQLIELGKLYEQEHGLRPRRPGRRRLSRVGRGEVIETLLRCLLRLARPAFRPELARLAEALRGEQGQAA
jgi:hypothetical protein